MPKMKKRIVFTGGPSGGKTSIIEIVRRHLGSQAVVVPEAATILYGGGFPRLPEAIRQTQRAIYHVVRELEDLTDLTSDAEVALCDRGTLDGMAYWPKTGESFLESLGSSLDKEYARYQLVLHLRSPKMGSLYQSSQHRIETHKKALELDRQIEQVWKDHPNIFIIDEEPDFLVKVNRVVEIIKNELPKI